MLRRKLKSIRNFRPSIIRNSVRRYNNYQEMNTDSLPSRSYINSLYCQQMDFDWFVPYPTLPSQQIVDIIMTENSRIERLIDPSNSISDCLENLKDTILFDIGIPLEYGGDPGPPGSTSIMQCGLCEGLGIHLPFAHYYANHTAAVETVLKYGNKIQKDLVCIDAISGFQTMFSTGPPLSISEENSMNGSCVIKGAAAKECTTFLIPVIANENIRYILISKKTPGITVSTETNEWEDYTVIFENVEVVPEAFLPSQSESNDEITYLDIERYLEDSYILLSSAAVLGCIKNRFDSAMEVFNVKSITGTKPVIKSDLGLNHMSHLMAHIYGYESTLYAVAGKRPWASESLTSEILTLKILANQSLEWYDDLLSNMGLLSGYFPWDLYRKQLISLTCQLSDHDCYLMIGLRGFQAQVSQQADMEKRLHESWIFSREFRRIYGWRANWKFVNPELPSFGWSMFNKNNTWHRKYTFTIKNNILGRTKKDGAGTFADLGNDLNKRNKYYYEFACRDFCHIIVQHAEQYGTFITDKQWIVVESGKVASDLFIWGTCFARSEKSHMTGIRGFELEKDLAMYAMDKLNEKVTFNIDFATSAWYEDTMAPYGKQRALSTLILGESILTK